MKQRNDKIAHSRVVLNGFFAQIFLGHTFLDASAHKIKSFEVECARMKYFREETCLFHDLQPSSVKQRNDKIAHWLACVEQIFCAKIFGSHSHLDTAQ